MMIMLSTAVRIFNEKSPAALEQAINDHLKIFENKNQSVQTTVNIQYTIAEENSAEFKKELIYSALVHITISAPK